MQNNARRGEGSSPFPYNTWQVTVTSAMRGTIPKVGSYESGERFVAVLGSVTVMQVPVMFYSAMQLRDTFLSSRFLW